jgi:hypothetical protein
VDIPTVQKLMGHSTISMTVPDAHLAPQHQLAAAERLGTRIAGQAGTTTYISASEQETPELAIAV